MSEPLQATWIDNFFNSTFSLPQQLIWRIWRAAKDDKIDLFSEKGLLDPALLPGVGMFFDHKNDVMADWAAENIGFAEKGKSGFGSQLAAAVLLDPLSFLTSGATATARLGKAAVAAKRLPSFREAMLEAAGKANVTVDDYVRSLDHGGYNKLIDDALLKATDAREIRQLEKTKGLYNKHLTTATDEAKALNLDVPTLSHAMESTDKRRIAIGLPVLMLSGAKINVGQSSSWWDLFKSTVSAGGVALQKSVITQYLGKTPVLGAGLRGVNSVYRHGMFGLKHGQDARVLLPAATRSVSVDDTKALMPYLQPEGGRDLGRRYNRLLAKNPRLLDDVLDTFTDYTKGANALHRDEAFVKALKEHGVLAKNSSDDASAVWGRLTGVNAEDGVFPILPPSMGSARQVIKDTFSNFIAKHFAATKMLNDSNNYLVPQLSGVGKELQKLEKSADNLPGFFASFSKAAFSSGEKLRAGINKIFKTGESTAFFKTEYDRFLAEVARENDFVETMSHYMYRKLVKASKTQQDYSLEEMSDVIKRIVQLDFLPDELASTFAAFKVNPSNPQKLIDSLTNGLDRHFRSIVALEQGISTAGVQNSAVRQKLLDFFDEDVFSFYDRSVGGVSKDRLKKIVFGFGSTSEVKTTQRIVYSDRDKVRLRRKYNKHVMSGGHKSLAKHAGRRTGELTDTEIDAALDELSKATSRKVTDAEVLRQLSDADAMPNLHAYAQSKGVLIPDLMRAMRNKRTGARMTALQQIKPWDKTKKSWSTGTAQSELGRWRLQIVNDLDKDGNAIMRVAMDSGDEAVDLALGNAGWTRLPDLMADVRAALQKNGNAHLERHLGLSNKVKASRAYEAKLARFSIEDLNEARRAALRDGMSEDRLLGRELIEDQTLIDAASAGDMHYLRQLRARRALGKQHRLYEEGPIVGRTVDDFEVMPPRKAESRTLFTDGQLSGKQFSEWADAYSSAQHMSSEIARYIKQAQKNGVAVSEIPPEMLVDLEHSMMKASSVLRDAVLAQMPKEVADAYGLAKHMSRYSFQQAKRAGTWMPGSPIAYLPRYYDKQTRQRIQNLIGKVDVEDSNLLARLGVKQAEYFKRSLDDLTLDDLDDFMAELRRSINTRTATPKLRQLHDELDATLSATGVQIQGLTSPLKADAKRRMIHDPFVSLVQRLGVANQDKNLASYFDALLASNNGKNGESLLLGGRVLGRLADADRKIRSKYSKISKEYDELGTGEGLTLSQSEKLKELERNVIVLQDVDGNIRFIENAALNETGFGFMSLADDVADVAPEANQTIGHAFARASLRSDVHNSVTTGMLTDGAIQELVGKQVAFGSRNHLVSATKAASQVHQIAPQWLRTFDSINYGIKSLQTIFRLPFHVANLSSGIFQASMAGAGPKNLAMAYVDTLRLLMGDQKFARRADHLGIMLDVGAETHSLGVVNLMKGDRAMIQQIARLHGGGDFSRYLAKEAPELGQLEHLVIRQPGGAEIDLIELLHVAGEEQLYGTYASSLMRGSQTLGDNLTRIKMAALDPNLGGSRFARLKQRFMNIAETSEVINRTATAIALIREGHDMRRAVQMTKAAHVPYEKLTPFEKNYLKRASVYYTFPRHYMPWAWTKFAEDPQKLARLGHYVRDQQIITMQEGNATAAVGDYRINMGRLNANFEAATMFAAFADRIALPAAEMVGMRGSAIDRRFMRNAVTDSGLTSVGGILGLAADNFIPQGERTAVGNPNFFREAATIVWPFKVMRQLLGIEGGLEDQSIYTQYTPMEEWMSNNVFGLGVRKVRPANELMMAKNRYERIMSATRMKMMAATTPALRSRYEELMLEMSRGFAQIASETSQKR